MVGQGCGSQMTSLHLWFEPQKEPAKAVDHRLQGPGLLLEPDQGRIVASESVDGNLSMPYIRGWISAENGACASFALGHRPVSQLFFAPTTSVTISSSCCGLSLSVSYLLLHPPF